MSYNLMLAMDQLERAVSDLVEAPVEPKGILSRIESHAAEIKKVVCQPLLLDAAQHEFTRDFLVAMQSDVTTIKATLSTILEAQQIYNQSLAMLGSDMINISGALSSIDSRLYGIESKDKTLTGLVELQRRVARLEQRDERGYVDVPAGSGGSETAAAQGDGQAGPGRVPD